MLRMRGKLYDELRFFPIRKFYRIFVCLAWWPKLIVHQFVQNIICQVPTHSTGTFSIFFSIRFLITSKLEKTLKDRLHIYPPLLRMAFTPSTWSCSLTIHDRCHYYSMTVFSLYLFTVSAMPSIRKKQKQKPFSLI